MDAAIINGLFALGGTIVGSVIVIFKDIWNAKFNLRLERVRIHDKKWLEAHQNLYEFARKLYDSVFPLAVDKRFNFKEMMEGLYKEKVSGYCLYFRNDIQNLLEELEENYTCMTHPDLIPETREKHENKFLEERLFVIATQLKSKIKESVSNKMP